MNGFRKKEFSRSDLLFQPTGYEYSLLSEEDRLSNNELGIKEEQRQVFWNV